MACNEDRAGTGAEDANRCFIDLQLTVVRYPDKPDRATMFPTSTDDIDRMSTWLSADRSAFEPLDSMR
ncbi:hypothetical protein BRC91_04675 [Halobacteriales archaeon QS_4_62_28]|nr:MAG: hypothetical protein BRC91_04675 [Halobacteriales archaeon QS_4_62_28]